MVTGTLNESVLGECLARTLMTPNPISINARTTVRDALTKLLDKGIHGAAVIDSAGRPIGVISQTDIVRHCHERVEYACPVPEYYDKDELVLKSGDRLTEGFQVEAVDLTEVREVMTPVVYSVTKDAPASKVVQLMLANHVHRLFVVDEVGTLVGVISALDLLRRLQPA